MNLTPRMLRTLGLPGIRAVNEIQFEGDSSKICVMVLPHNTYFFEGIFHPVGNGLAYTGVWHERNVFFAYDLGYQNRQLGRILEEYYSLLKSCNYDPILLFISHFHADHIKFLPRFLQKFNPKVIVMPYFFSKEGLTITFSLASLVSMRASRSRVSREISNFLVNPVDFIRSASPRTKTIYLIRGFDRPDGAIDEPNINEPRDGELLKYVGSNIQEIDVGSNKGSRLSVYEVEGVGNWLGKICAFPWLFRAFNDLSYSDARSKLENFRKEVRSFVGKDPELLTAEEIYDLLSNSQKRKQLVDAYRKAFGDLNITSIQLWHGPNMESPVDTDLFCYGGCKNAHQYLPPLHFKRTRLFSGTYLSGDLPSGGNIGSIRQRFVPFLQKTGVVQIPHHGSSHTWNRGFLRLFLQNVSPVYVLSGLGGVPWELQQHFWVRYLVYRFYR